ncbi:hypothetical protein WG68_18875 [Arsukibacterium ikkense]|uniref:Uncharacterized protein n=1 Tax=Arsukibacterium ikkense TaxID=336831 RepID=A0A0M2UYZ5_9GAMM|nr:hypothetical protein WG68_18875 [Arsukibacterium ikkense]
MIKEMYQELERARSVPQGSGRDAKPQARPTMTFWQSDQLIVVRDGKAVHMAKGLAVISCV